MAEIYELVLRGRALLDGAEREASVAISLGRIAAVEAVDAMLEARSTHELAADEVLIPGLVDTHVHVNEPGRTEWEGFATATAAAAAGGVTTLIDMPLNSIPPTTTVANLREKQDAARGATRVDVGFWGGAVPGNLGTGDLRALHDAGVFGFKCFLAPSGVDEFPHLSTAELHLALAELAEFDGLLIVHAEDPGVLHDHESAGGPSYPSYEASRPAEAETTAIEHVVAALRRTGGRAHILHVSSASAVATIRAAQTEGVRLTAETCPHYLSIADSEIGDGQTQFKCAPPIRDEANRDALWAAVEDGTLGIIVTDHSPSTRELKFAGSSVAGRGDFGVAWGGISGLQLGLSAVWTEARRRGVPLAAVVDRMSRATADFAGLGDRGRIAVGARADLAAFAPDERFTVDARELAHKNPVTAYDGRELTGRARATWLRGRRVGESAPQGELLVRPPTHTPNRTLG